MALAQRSTVPAGAILPDAPAALNTRDIQSQREIELHKEESKIKKAGKLIWKTICFLFKATVIIIAALTCISMFFPVGILPVLGAAAVWGYYKHKNKPAKDPYQNIDTQVQTKKRYSKAERKTADAIALQPSQSNAGSQTLPLTLDPAIQRIMQARSIGNQS
jgi:hypothetical protein